MKRDLLEFTPTAQTEAILDIVQTSEYPLDATDRLSYLSHHYHALPLGIVINDTLWASAQRADEWVSNHNASRGQNSHMQGHVAALNEALQLVGTDADSSVSNPVRVRESIRNIANGKDSFGKNVYGEIALRYRAITFHNNVDKANISDATKRAFRHIFQAEAAKRYIIRELEQHWAAFPTEGFPLSVLSRLDDKNDPASRMNGYWKGRTIGYTRNGVGLMAANKILDQHVDNASKEIYKDAVERKLDLKPLDLALLIEQMRSVINLRTSKRDKKETATELRLPIIESFSTLDHKKPQAALEDLWLHNPQLFTPASFRLLGLTRSDVDVFQGLLSEVRQMDAQKQSQRDTELLAEQNKFLEDCNDPTILQLAHEELGGKVIAMPAIVAKKYGGGVLRFVQKGSLRQTGRGGKAYEVLILRRLQVDDSGKLNVLSQRTATVKTATVLRRIMTGEIKIVEDAEVNLPDKLKD